MRYYLLALLIFSCNTLLAQNQKVIDSLLQVTKSSISDKKKVDVYIRVAKEYSGLDSSKTYQYANWAVQLALKVKYSEGEIDALQEIGKVNRSLANYKEAEKIFRQIIQKANESQYSKGKANGLNEIGLIYSRKGKYDEALEYYFKALKIFKKLDDKKGIASIYSGLGTTHGIQGKYDKALEYYSKALKINEAINHKMGIANTCNNIGLIHGIQGKYDKALEFHFKVLKVRKEVKDKKGIAITFNNIGIIYRKKDNYKEALKYYFKALEINKEIKYEEGVAHNYGNLGIIYSKQNNYKPALKYYFNALEIFKKLKDKKSTANCLDNIGGIYIAQENYEKALGKVVKSLEIYEEVGAKGKKTGSLLSLGKIYYKQKKWQLSKKYLQKCLDLSQEVGFMENIRDAAEQLALLEKELGNYKAAYEYHFLFKQMTDSLHNEEQIKKFTRLEDEYEFQQEKDSIQFANQAQQEILEKEIKNRKTTQIATFIGLGLSLALVISLIFLFRNQKRYSLKLESKNKEVEVQNEELMVMNEKLSDSEQKQKKLNDLKDKLFSIISHDLKGPLAAISSFLDLFVNYRALSEEESLKIATGLTTTVKSTSFLLENLLHWAKAQMNNHSFEAVEVVINKLIDNNIELFENIAMSKHIVLSQGKQEDLNVWADLNMLDFTIRNLLSNAIKFTPEGGKIKVSSQRKDKFLQVEVRDSGVGINPEVIKKIFSETEHVSTFGTSNEKGTGLGLKLCKDFVNQNGGEIWIKSELGKGTSFYFTIPLSI